MLRNSGTKTSRGSPYTAAGRQHRADRPRNGTWNIRDGMEIGPSRAQGKQVLCRSHGAAGSIAGDMGKVPQGISR